ncbi:MAG TPA: penicillin-binding protein [Thermoanaerobaculia bacterium]|jgi:cell division protein FtsI (penicillin-binding protein 3)
MNRRLVFLLALLASWFLALGARLYQLQVVRHDHFRERAERQQNRVVELTPPRGTIFDRRGHELAVSVEVRSVAADPTLIADPAATAAALAKVLGLDAGRLAAELGADRGFVWVRRKIAPERAAAVDGLGLDGVFLLPENKRYYPLASLAAPVLGFVGTDNSGLAGLEFLYDPVVAPEPGRRIVVRDARFGTVLYPHHQIAAARPGQDLHLTLDAAVQHVVEQELARAVREAGAVRGMVVVMEPATGAVLAMASYPGFDPNRFADYPEERWRNLPVTDAYEPGSTFKMVTLAAALESGTLQPWDVFDCEMGGIRFGRTLIKDHKAFGRLSVREILARSSNVGAIKIGQAAGRERFYAAIRAFGFGRPTGIDLPSESAGIVRPLERWSPLSPAYHAFGQGLSVTAVQLTVAFAAIANGGRLVKPYVVERIGEGGEPAVQARRPEVPEVVGLPISPSSVRQIREMLAEVVAAGTAKAAAVPGYSVAGKTGTAQKAVAGGGYAANRHVASFVGFAPVDDPAVVVTVILDEPRPRYHGGEVAAPAFQAIAARTLLYLGVPPERDVPEVWPGERPSDVPSVRLAAQLEAEPAAAPQRAETPRAETPPGTMPDFAGLSARQALLASSRLGIRSAVHGHGAVVRQEPPPGTPLEAAGGRVELYLKTTEGT